MSLYNQLTSILHLNSYDSVTFYLNQVPIVTVHFNNENNTITLITNNMHEMNYHIFSYSNDVIVEIDNALIDDGIEELLHNPNASLTFQALFLNGTINHNQVQLEQLEIIDSNDNTSHFTYTFPITSLTGLIISEIIMAFAHQYFS